MIEQLRKQAKVIEKELQDVKKIISETDDARRENDGAYSKQKSLSRKYWKLMEEIEHLDRYSANKELQNIVKKIADAYEEDCNSFSFFTKAEAKFSSFGKKGRELNVEIVCSQVCDHDVKIVLANAEKITKRKLIDWFISASIGFNPNADNATAWLTYHLTFKGEDI